MLAQNVTAADRSFTPERALCWKCSLRLITVPLFTFQLTHFSPYQKAGKLMNQFKRFVLGATVPFLAVTLALVLSHGSLRAQGVTTASLSGIIATDKGDALPGANVMAVHQPSGTRYGATSRANGQFNILNVKIGGPYVVTASILGYKKESQSNVYLNIGQDLRIDFRLVEQPIAGPEVVITAKLDKVMNSGRTGAAPASRVVNVSSQAHRYGSIEFDDPGFEKGYNAMKSYAQSKLANLLFTYELSRHLAGTGITANALHPGAVRTGFGKDLSGIAGLVFKRFDFLMRSPEKGAETVIWLASSAEPEQLTGKYFCDRRELRSSRVSHDRDVAKRLWEASAQMTGLGFH